MENGKVIMLDFDLDREEFEKSLDIIIEKSVSNSASLGLPIQVDGKLPTLMISTILSVIDCTNCGGRCCTGEFNAEKGGIGIGFTEKEMARIVNKYGVPEDAELVVIGKIVTMKMPCIFLKEGKCSIYEDRPIVCRMFPLMIPLQTEQGRCFSVLSECPGAQKFFKSIFMHYWEFKRYLEDNFKTLADQNFIEGFLGHYI